MQDINLSSRMRLLATCGLKCISELFLMKVLCTALFPLQILSEYETSNNVKYDTRIRQY